MTPVMAFAAAAGGTAITGTAAAVVTGGTVTERPGTGQAVWGMDRIVFHCGRIGREQDRQSGEWIESFCGAAASAGNRTGSRENGSNRFAVRPHRPGTGQAVGRMDRIVLRRGCIGREQDRQSEEWIESFCIAAASAGEQSVGREERYGKKEEGTYRITIL